MTTYEVGTTALLDPFYGVPGEYRERHADGKWYDRRGVLMISDDDHVENQYADITPPGPPLPAGTVLDPGKRYVRTEQWVPSAWVQIVSFVNDAWQGASEQGVEWRNIHSGPETVTEYGCVYREIREPGSANQESRPEWDAVKIDVTRVADREPRYIYVSTEDIATTEAEADEARAECTRLSDGWDNAAELLSVANDEACELQKTAANWKQSFENVRLLREAGRTKHIAEMNKNDQDRANWWKEREELKTRLNESERLRKQHWTDLLVAEAEGRKSLEEDKESERVREAQQSQIRALEAKVLTRETALKAAQAAISRGLQKTRTDKAEAAGYLYTGRFLSKDNIWYARYDGQAKPVDETVAGYFTD